MLITLFFNIKKKVYNFHNIKFALLYLEMCSSDDLAGSYTQVAQICIRYENNFFLLCGIVQSTVESIYWVDD